MTDSARLADPRPAVMALPEASAVILRHYDDPDRAGLGRELKALCRKKKLTLLVAGDARLALSIDADGLHLAESFLSQNPGTWRLWLRPGMLLSIAAHSPKALAKAAAADADLALLSPVFPTKSHPDVGCIGVLRFTRWIKKAGLPVYALGGVNKGNALRLHSGGAAGWAAIGGLSENADA